MFWVWKSPKQTVAAMPWLDEARYWYQMEWSKARKELSRATMHSAMPCTSKSFTNGFLPLKRYECTFALENALKKHTASKTWSMQGNLPCTLKTDGIGFAPSAISCRPLTTALGALPIGRRMTIWCAPFG